MRLLALASILAFATATVLCRARAQPGPGPPVTVEDARALDLIVAREGARAWDRSLRPSMRIAAARAVAEAIEELGRKVTYDPESIDPRVGPMVHARLGVGLDGLAAAAERGFEVCRALVAETHGLDQHGLACLFRPSDGAFSERARLYVLHPGSRYLRARTADGSAAVARALEARLRANAGDATTRRRLLGVYARTGDADGALAALGSLAAEYEAEVTVGVALHRARRSREALSRLARAAGGTPDRPEAWYALAVILDEELFEPGPPLVTTYRVRFELARAYLCTRGAARLVEPAGAWEHAARVADAGQWQGYAASHTTWHSSGKRPLPFVRDALMPPAMRGDRRRPNRSCNDALGRARAIARALGGPGFGALPRLDRP